jgi:hypothetical protein
VVVWSRIGLVDCNLEESRKGMRRMWRKWVMLLCLLVIVAGLVVSLMQEALAARGGGMGDLGMEGGAKKAEQVLTSERPTKLKIAIGVGSVVVAILVLKFL